MKLDSINALFVWSRPLEFHETDAAGLAHFSNFYRWMESAEHAFLNDRGIKIGEKMNGKKIAWPRVQSECRFVNPIRFGDVVEVTISEIEVKNSSIHYQFQIRAAGSTNLAAEGSIIAVCVEIVDGEITSCPIPDAIRAKLALTT